MKSKHKDGWDEKATEREVKTLLAMWQLLKDARAEAEAESREAKRDWMIRVSKMEGDASR
jgi:hypothetical protein